MCVVVSDWQRASVRGGRVEGGEVVTWVGSLGLDRRDRPHGREDGSESGTRPDRLRGRRRARAKSMGTRTGTTDGDGDGDKGRAQVALRLEKSPSGSPYQPALQRRGVGVVGRLVWEKKETPVPLCAKARRTPGSSWSVLGPRGPPGCWVGWERVCQIQTTPLLVRSGAPANDLTSRVQFFSSYEVSAQLLSQWHSFWEAMKEFVNLFPGDYVVAVAARWKLQAAFFSDKQSSMAAAGSRIIFARSESPWLKPTPCHRHPFHQCTEYEKKALITSRDVQVHRQSIQLGVFLAARLIISGLDHWL